MINLLSLTARFLSNLPSASVEHAHYKTFNQTRAFHGVSSSQLSLVLCGNVEQTFIGTCSTY